MLHSSAHMKLVVAVLEASSPNLPMHWAWLVTHDGRDYYQYHGPIPLSIVRTLIDYAAEYRSSPGSVQLTKRDARALYEWVNSKTKLHVYPFAHGDG